MATVEMLSKRDFPLIKIEVKGSDGIFRDFTARPFCTSEAAEAHLQLVRSQLPTVPAENFRVAVYTEDDWRRHLLEEILASKERMALALEAFVPNEGLCWALLKPLELSDDD